SVVSLDVKYRALDVAARAAHVGSREEEALNLFREACNLAPDPARSRKAMWGQVVCAGALELPESQELMKNLEASSSSHDPAEIVRLVDRQLALGFRFGYVRHLADARRIAELVPRVPDPFVRCSFWSVYSWALMLGCFYEEAHAAAEKLLNDAVSYRVDV